MTQIRLRREWFYACSISRLRVIPDIPPVYAIQVHTLYYPRRITTHHSSVHRRELFQSKYIALQYFSENLKLRYFIINYRLTPPAKKTFRQHVITFRLLHYFFTYVLRWRTNYKIKSFLVYIHILLVLMFKFIANYLCYKNKSN